MSDHLTPLFGANHVFMDVDDIRPGENFAQAIDKTIAACSAVLVVIGPRWMEILRKRSEDQQPDYVCREIETALARKTLVIPVLVGGAGIAQLTGLPSNLAELALHEAIELRDTTFIEDCARLANALGIPDSPPPQPSDRAIAPKKLALWIAGSAALLAVVFALLAWAGVGPWSNHLKRTARVAQTVNTAQVQIGQGEYESAFQNYQDALKVDPGERTLLDRQLDAAMLWAESFHVLAAEGQKSEELAAPRLRQIISTLESGLARTDGQGSRTADILAHLGWTHWL
ncbi:MAG: toll/interleukin-1 receptor domain-containing protein, partial [Acidobacteriota bacterium]|nr:toll/interleukin-1 receptor domain-containing protein [Acidobacteriota bacterium]